MELDLNITIPPSTSIREALKIINKEAKRIALVVDQDLHLLGTLADGDIRRGLLKGVELDDPVKKVMETKPTYCYINDNIEDIIDIALTKKVYQIPVLNSQRVLVGLHEIDNLIKPEKKTNPVVIMAGGQGARLRPLTADVPKPLLNVGGKPILETIIRNFKKHGFYHFYLSVNYKSDMIRSTFGNGAELGVKIQYLEEKKKLGTAGAIGKLKGKIDQDFIVMNGDILTNINFNKFLSFHIEKNSLATMGVRPYEHQIPYGVIKTNKNHITKIMEKPIQTSLVNAGVYIFSPDILKIFKPDHPIDMPSVFENLLQNNKKVLSYDVKEYWIDIGRLDELRRADSEFHDFF